MAAESPFEDVYIVSYARTPVSSFQGGLSGLTACELGGLAIKGAIQRAGLADRQDLVDEVLMGNVLSGGLGQAPASQAALLAGLPSSIPATLVNKVCASGLKAAMLAAASIRTCMAEIVVAGGMESMSRAPYILPESVRNRGFHYGDQTIVDTLRLDGLTDSKTGWSMGLCVEECAREFGITREQSDSYARSSYERAIAARDNLQKEIIPVAISSSKAKSSRPNPGNSPEQFLSSDEGPNKFDPEKMASLRSSFRENGTITAANASPLSDGAAALVLASGRAVRQHGLPTLARVITWADAAQAGVDFATTPALAIRKALKQAKMTLQDVNFFEINEAFSTVPLVHQQLLGIDPDRCNVFGGAVAIGHPLGCSGARILGTLTNILDHHGARRGLAAVCNGGGGASAMIIERI